MNTEGLWTRENLDGIEEDDGLLIVNDSGGNFIDPEIVWEYIGSSTDPDALGVPVPTAADAGKVLTVNETGNGFLLTLLQESDPVWENPNPTANFAAQTIACDNSPYSMFAIYHVSNASENNAHKMTFVPKNGREICLSQEWMYEYLAVKNMRKVSIDDNGFTFLAGVSETMSTSVGYKKFTGYGGSKYCVPLKIYGIR